MVSSAHASMGFYLANGLLLNPLQTLLGFGARSLPSERNAMPARRFPLLWSVEDIGAAFVVKDSAPAESAGAVVPSIRWFNTSASEPRTHDAR